ncbi:dehydrogenase [bacterium]|nr:dehydrogenase [bacterium]
MMDLTVCNSLLDALKAGTPCCLVTVVATTGSAPRHAGASMLVYADGRTVGTIGGSLVERQAISQAVSSVASNQPSLSSFSLASSARENEGMICGGEMTLYFEPHGRARHLYLFGGGHCGLALACAAAPCGFTIHVHDDRPAFASRERFPMAASIECGSYDALSSALDPRPDAFIVIMTEGHAADAAVLRNVIAKNYAYLGMICSRRKRDEVFGALRAQGVPQESLDAVHAPVGLAIGAETPEEIAVSIVAELVKEVHGS